MQQNKASHRKRHRPSWVIDLSISQDDLDNRAGISQLPEEQPGALAVCVWSPKMCAVLAGRQRLQSMRFWSWRSCTNPLPSASLAKRRSQSSRSSHSRIHETPNIGTRQYARIVDSWVTEIGLNPFKYGTQSMRRTKASLIYRRTKNLRAVQLLLGHTKLESTVRYLGIEVDDALEMAEQTEI